MREDIGSEGEFAGAKTTIRSSNADQRSVSQWKAYWSLLTISRRGLLNAQVTKPRLSPICLLEILPKLVDGVALAPVKRLSHPRACDPLRFDLRAPTALLRELGEGVRGPSVSVVLLRNHRLYISWFASFLEALNHEVVDNYQYRPRGIAVASYR
jgi:hypothetical protein